MKMLNVSTFILLLIVMSAIVANYRQPCTHLFFTKKNDKSVDIFFYKGKCDIHFFFCLLQKFVIKLDAVCCQLPLIVLKCVTTCASTIQNCVVHIFFEL